MKLIFKLILLCALIDAVMPVIATQSPVSAVIRAAAADAMTFCERRPDACAEGALFAEQTRRALFALISRIGAPSQDPNSLTDDDRALAPAAPPLTAPIKVQTTLIAPPPSGDAPASAQDRKSAFAGHGKSFSY